MADSPDTRADTPDKRTVTLGRLDEGIYVARNARGHELRFGSKDPDGFTPVELLLAALAGCTAVDVDVVTGRQAAADVFEARVDADYRRDAGGNVLENLTLTFNVTFPEGEAGDRARDRLPKALRTAHDRTCTVSRTIEAGQPITVAIE